MLTILLVAAVQAAPSCPPVRFAFVGQPDCVALAWDGRVTHLHSSCMHQVVLDDSVILPGSGGPVVEAGGDAVLRDLSAFTLGMDGDLYRVRAVVAEGGRCEEPEAVPAVGALDRLTRLPVLGPVIVALGLAPMQAEAAPVR